MTEAPTSANITDLLKAHQGGDRAAFDDLVPLVYTRLRSIAKSQARRNGRGSTLDTTALVNEAYLQLVAETGIEWQDRSHFYAICARAMRRILVDYARHTMAQKRGGDYPPITLPTDEAIGTPAEPAELVLAVDAAVAKLSAFNARLAQVVECRFFAGMTSKETASALGASLRTVERDWQRAKAWLRRELE